MRDSELLLELLEAETEEEVLFFTRRDRSLGPAFPFMTLEKVNLRRHFRRHSAPSFMEARRDRTKEPFDSSKVASIWAARACCPTAVSSENYNLSFRECPTMLPAVTIMNGRTRCCASSRALKIPHGDI